MEALQLGSVRILAPSLAKFGPLGVREFEVFGLPYICDKSGRSEVIELTDAQRAAWKKALLPVHKENESRVGKDTLGAVYRQTGFKP